jgi:hypothetical protein
MDLRVRRVAGSVASLCVAIITAWVVVLSKCAAADKVVSDLVMDVGRVGSSRPGPFSSVTVEGRCLLGAQSLIGRIIRSK